MSGTPTPIFPQTVVNFTAQIQNADSTNLVTLVTGGTNGTKIESISVSSTDTSARDLLLYMTVSAVDYLLTTINIPINSGNTNAIPAVDILRSAQIPALAFDNNGNRYLYVANGSTLKIAVGSAVTAAKVIAAFAQGGDF